MFSNVLFFFPHVDLNVKRTTLVLQRLFKQSHCFEVCGCVGVTVNTLFCGCTYCELIGLSMSAVKSTDRDI